MRDNSPSHISDKTTELIKIKKNERMQGLTTINQDLNTIIIYLGINQIKDIEGKNNQRSELILDIKNVYDSINNEEISSLIESFPSRFNNKLKIKEKGFHYNFRNNFYSHYLTQFF